MKKHKRIDQISLYYQKYFSAIFILSLITLVLFGFVTLLIEKQESSKQSQFVTIENHSSN